MASIDGYEKTISSMFFAAGSPSYAARTSALIRRRSSGRSRNSESTTSSPAQVVRRELAGAVEPHEDHVLQAIDGLGHGALVRQRGGLEVVDLERARVAREDRVDGLVELSKALRLRLRWRLHSHIVPPST